MISISSVVGRCVVALIVSGGTGGPAAAHEHEPSPRFKADCERLLKPTAISVVSYPSEVVYDFKRGVRELTQRPTRKSREGLHTVLGLTEAKFQLETEWKGDMLQDTMTRMYCTRPQIRIAVQIGPQRVSVAKEFEKDSCAFWEIAAHELKHVQANQDQVEAVATEMQSELRRSFGNRVFYGTRTELSRAFSQNPKEEWLPWGKTRFDQVASLHDTIDSPQEYARNRTMCDGEVVQVLSKHRDEG